MKNLNLRFAFLVLFIFSACLHAAGGRTHIEISKLAVELLEDDPIPGLHSYLDYQRNAIYSGSISPDWGYALLSDEARGYSEDAHSFRFLEIYNYVLYEKYRDLNTLEAQQEYAFFLGVVAHVYSDWIWHGSNGEWSFLEEAMRTDHNTHDFIEGAIDFMLAHEAEIEPFDWFFPLETIAQVYHEFGDTGVTTSMLNSGFSFLRIGYRVVMTSDTSVYHDLCDTLPFSNEHYMDYYPGGAINCTQVTAQYFRKNWVKDYTGALILQRTQHNTGYENTADLHLLSDLPFNNTGGEHCLVATRNTGDGTTLLSWSLDEIEFSSDSLDSAKVFLYLNDAPTLLSGDKVLSLFKVNRGWIEGNLEDGADDTFLGLETSSEDLLANWNYAANGEIPWSLPGANGIPGDREGFPVAQKMFSPYTPLSAWYSWNITRVMESWLSATDENFGLLLREEPNEHLGEILFTSGESQQISHHPMLILYTPISTGITESVTAGLPRRDLLLTAYPNPFNSSVTIALIGAHHADHSVETLHATSLQLEVFDINGRVVLKSPLTPLTNGDNCPGSPDSRITGSPLYSWTPKSSLPGGLYLLKVSNGEKTAVTRILYLK